MLTKRWLKIESILKISDDLLIHVINAKAEVGIEVESSHLHIAEEKTSENIEQSAYKKDGESFGNLILSRNNFQEIILIGKDEKEELEKTMYLIRITSKKQVRLRISAPKNYLILRREKLNDSQEKFLAEEKQKQLVLN